MFAKINECLDAYIKHNSIVEDLNENNFSLTEAITRDDIENTFEYYGLVIELARNIVYDFVSDQAEAELFYNDPIFNGLDSLEELALEGLINNALVGANEHEDAENWIDHIKWGYCWDLSQDAYDIEQKVYKSLKTNTEKINTLCDCLNIMALDGLVTESL